jgi:hypothetical protein
MTTVVRCGTRYMEPWNSVAGTFWLHTNVIMTEAVPVFGKGRCEPAMPSRGFQSGCIEQQVKVVASPRNQKIVR